MPFYNSFCGKRNRKECSFSFDICKSDNMKEGLYIIIRWFWCVPAKVSWEIYLLIIIFQNDVTKVWMVTTLKTKIVQLLLPWYYILIILRVLKCHCNCFSFLAQYCNCWIMGWDIFYFFFWLRRNFAGKALIGFIISSLKEMNKKEKKSRDNDWRGTRVSELVNIRHLN